MPTSAPLPLSQSLTLSLIGMLLVLLELTMLALAVLLLSRLARRFAPQQAGAAPDFVSSAGAASAVSEQTHTVDAAFAMQTTPATGAAPLVELVDVDEPTAAMLMAIVAHTCPIPANRLLFRRISGLVELSGLDETTARAVAEQTARMLGKPVEQLRFLSIRLVEDET